MRVQPRQVVYPNCLAEAVFRPVWMRLVSHADAPEGTTRRTTAVDWLMGVRRRAEAHGISRSETDLECPQAPDVGVPGEAATDGL